MGRLDAKRATTVTSKSICRVHPCYRGRRKATFGSYSVGAVLLDGSYDSLCCPLWDCRRNGRNLSEAVATFVFYSQDILFFGAGAGQCMLVSTISPADRMRLVSPVALV